MPEITIEMTFVNLIHGFVIEESIVLDFINVAARGCPGVASPKAASKYQRFRVPWARFVAQTCGVEPDHAIMYTYFSIAILSKSKAHLYLELEVLGETFLIIKESVPGTNGGKVIAVYHNRDSKS